MSLERMYLSVVRRQLRGNRQLTDIVRHSSDAQGMQIPELSTGL